MTDVQLEDTDPTRAKLDLLAALAFQGEQPPAWADAASGGAAGRAVRAGDFKGQARRTTLLYGEGRAARVLLVGLGAKDGADLERVRQAVGCAVREARRLKLQRVGVVLPAELPDGLERTAALGAAAEAALLAGYRFDRHKSKPEKKKEPARRPLQVTLFGPREARGAVARAIAVGEGVNLARDLANEPGNFGTPSALAAAARKAGRSAGFKVTVLERADMKRLGMGALLGVAKGSSEPPAFIQMEYAPPGRARAGALPTVCLVGKGLTFDSGGISLKPADKMWEMKFDKCGGCAVIGAMAAVARAGLPCRVVGLVPSTENMPGGAANKPGDVLRALNGKTIEVLNTDAEGRLILADALAYAARFEPDVILDMATLTGACVVALGDVRAAVLSPDEELASEVRAAGEASGDLVWPLPMDEAYGEHVKSDVADVKNLGKGRAAGTIAGAWFLKHFVPEGRPWAHLDIAGTAWSADPARTYLGKGATGFGVRLAFELIRARVTDAAEEPAAAKPARAARAKKKKAGSARPRKKAAARRR